MFAQLTRLEHLARDRPRSTPNQVMLAGEHDRHDCRVDAGEHEVGQRRTLGNEAPIAGRHRDVVQSGREQPQPVARRTHVGIDEYERLNGVGEVFGGNQQVVHLLAARGRDARHDQPRLDARILLHHAANGAGSGVRVAFHDEHDLVVRMILLKQRPEVRFEIVIEPLAGHEQGDVLQAPNAGGVARRLRGIPTVFERLPGQQQREYRGTGNRQPIAAEQPIHACTFRGAFEVKIKLIARGTSGRERGRSYRWAKVGSMPSAQPRRTGDNEPD